MLQRRVVQGKSQTTKIFQNISRFTERRHDTVYTMMGNAFSRTRGLLVWQDLITV